MRVGTVTLALLAAASVAACGGGTASPGPAPTPAWPHSGVTPGPPSFIIVPAYSTSAPTPAITVTATPPPIVLYAAQRSFPFGSATLVTVIATPTTGPVPQLFPQITGYRTLAPAIASVSTSDTRTLPPQPLPASVALLSLTGYGATRIEALAGAGALTSTAVYTYRSVNLSCDILGVNGLTFAADGSASTATAPSNADVYFTAPVPSPGVGSCTNPAFASPVTSALTFPSGATLVPTPNGFADFATLAPAAFTNDFTVLPAARPPSYAIVFRAASGATVKYMGPGLYEAAPAGATAFPY